MEKQQRLIDGDALKRWLETNKANANPLDYNTKATYAECITMVEAMEAIEAEPVRNGRWERENIRPKSYLRVCSACGKVAYFCGTGCSYKYCPNCGAKMDLKGK